MWCPSRGAPMSDNLRNAGPAGQPRATAPSSGPLSPPRSLSGRSDEDPTSLMKKRAPWPAPGESPVYGPLSIDHMDEYVSRVFRPPNPAAKAIELKLERIRLKRGRYQLKSAVEQLARDQKEVEGLVEQLKRLQEPQPQPQRSGDRPAGDPSAKKTRSFSGDCATSTVATAGASSAPRALNPGKA